jgi:hypothetical protein
LSTVRERYGNVELKEKGAQKPYSRGGFRSHAEASSDVAFNTLASSAERGCKRK